MKKLIFRFSIILFLLFLFFITFLSTIGIETNKFNNQIGGLIKNLNKDLEIKLNKVKIILDPIRLELNVKTVGPKLKIKEKTIQLESIKTQISINSLVKNEFSVKDLDISTKSLQVKNLISFLRKLQNLPELYLLEKIFTKGYLISDIKLEFKENGEIKNNYKISGLLKDSQILFSKEYNFNRLELIFNFEDDVFKFNDMNFNFKNTKFSSEKITVKKLSNDFLIEGIVDNKDTTLENKLVKNFVETYFKKIEFKNLIFNAKNKFSLRVNKKLKLNNFELSSAIELQNLKLSNSLDLKKIFPKIQNILDLNNHIINLDYNKKKLSIRGEGDVLFQNKNDKISYNIIKKNNLYNFETNIIIEKNPLFIEILGYEKKLENIANIYFTGSYIKNKNTIIEKFSLNDNENKFEIDQLSLAKNFQIDKFKEIKLDYLDKDLRKNNVSLSKVGNNYILAGTSYNANYLIENLINEVDSKKFRIFNQNFDLDIKIKEVYFDKKYFVKDLIGKLNIKKNEIVNADLKAFFSQDKKFDFSIKSSEQEKVTTFFLDHAEPIINRYKFIKGFKEGSLDFYSLKKEGKSDSNLKIYNFKLKELPILTKLLTLASLQGIADILSGEGITFDELEMNFKNENNLMTIKEMYAIGPAISILMDGYVEKNKLVSLRGSLVPATTINKVIGTIPILGKILVGSKTGEGVFGVSFKIKGPPKNLETTVNPIKTLTPRFITRTLEKIKKN